MGKLIRADFRKGQTEREMHLPEEKRILTHSTMAANRCGRTLKHQSSSRFKSRL